MDEAGSLVVMVVDDHPLIRRALGLLLEAEPRVAVVVPAATAAEATRLAVTEQPDVAVVDLGLPDGDGIEVTAAISRTVPTCRVLVLTMSSAREVVGACLAAGARGFLRKDTQPEAVVTAVLAVADGMVVMGQEPFEAAVHQGEAAVPTALRRLSPRDLTILAMIGEGRDNPDIARTLGVTTKTVRNRVSTLLGILGVADRVQAALVAKEAGLERYRGDRR